MIASSYSHAFDEEIGVFLCHDTGLEVYVDYQVIVAAGTSFGFGPYSDSVSVKTLEDGKALSFYL